MTRDQQIKLALAIINPEDREQCRADTRFELADGARQRRLRDMQRGGGAAEVKPLGDRDEVTQLAQVRGIHTFMVLMIAFYCIGLQYKPRLRLALPRRRTP